MFDYKLLTNQTQYNYQQQFKLLYYTPVKQQQKLLFSLPHSPPLLFSFKLLSFSSPQLSSINLNIISPPSALNIIIKEEIYNIFPLHANFQMQAKLAPNDSAVNSFIIAIKSSSIQDVKKMIDMYTPELVNKLELQSRQPSIFFSAVIIDEQRAYEIMKLLLEAGANPHFKDQALQTVLFYAAREGKTKCFELLIDAGMSFNDADIYGQTPLYYIARENRLSLIEVIDQKNVKVDYNNCDKIASQTALFYSARQGNLEMCKALIERGANVLHQDAAHKTAAIYAKKNDKNEVYEYLNAEIQKLKTKNDDKRKIKKPPQVKQQYKMMKSDEFGNAVEMTEADFEEFLKQYPDFRAMFQNPDGIDPEKIEEVKNQESWEKSAMRIINNCWKAKNASIFYQPVDPIKMKIIDYLDIVKEPMDFGTIKKKLTYNVYSGANKFIYDMNLVFSNCTLYNGQDNPYGKAALEIKAYFDEQIREAGIDTTE